MSLDPTDWAAVRVVARRMLDDMLDYQETVRERVPWRPVPAEVRARLDEPVPFEGAALAEVYESFRRDVLPYPTGNIHPRFWGWVMGTGTPWSASRDLVAGQELADSIAFDLHKWGYMPYEVGVVLTRDADAQLAAFGPHADGAGAAYLVSLKQGISADSTYFADRGLQLSRGFRALKVWMSMKEQGVARIGAAIQANIDQARHLAGRIEGEPRLELLAPVSLNTVCFRYVGESVPDGSVLDESLDALNQKILTELQVRGIAVPSQTILGGRFAIRVCITNHRSELSDFDALVEAVLALGAEITAQGTACAI
jgi:aromatic-L-amino-acid/L-tryptophan decarboxylase